MSELVYPLKLPVVSSLPSASTMTGRMVIFSNRIYFSDGTQWLRIDQDAETVDGFHASTGQISSSWYNRIPVISSTGTLDIGQSIDFHYDSSETNDYSIRLTPWSTRSNLSIGTAQGYWRTLATISGSAVIIYVDNINGSDTTGTGSSSSPFATVSRALDEVGQFYNANITIILKKSSISYGTITLSGFIRRNASSVLTIQGEMDTLASGTVSSFSNSVNDPVYGSSVQVARITDSTQNWTTDQYKHKLLRVYKGSTSYYRVITNNDTTNVYCSQTFPVTIDNTWSYEILDWGTRVDSLNVRDNFGQINISFLNIERASDGVTCVASSNGHFACNLNSCRLSAISTQTNSILQINRSYCQLTSCLVNGANVSGINNYLVFLNGNSGLLWMAGVIVENCSSGFLFNVGDWSGINIYDGCRIYRGTSNPSICIYMRCGSLGIWSGNGRVVIDCGTTAIQTERMAVVHSASAPHYGSNVTNMAVSTFGGFNDTHLISQSYLSVGQTNLSNIHSRLQVAGSVATQVSTVTSNTTLDHTHHIVLVNASGGNRTITLPSASTCSGRQYIVKKIDSSTNTVTISPQSGQTIDGQSSYTLSSQYQFVGVVSDGSNWFRIE